MRSGDWVELGQLLLFSFPQHILVVSNENSDLQEVLVSEGRSVSLCHRPHSRGPGVSVSCPRLLTAEVELVVVGEARADPEFPCHILDFFFVSPYRSDSASLKVSNAYASFQIELSAEAKAALLEFEERERQHKQGRYGSRRGGRRGGSSLCRGVGDQRRESSERGRAKDHRPALLPTQPPVAVSRSALSWEPAR